MPDFRASFAPETIEKTALELAEIIPYMRDWTGCTRLDIAVELMVPTNLLEQGMALCNDLYDTVVLIEERSLAADLVKMPGQISDKHVNASILAKYLEQKYGRTTRVIEAKQGVEDKPAIPSVNIYNTGKDGSEHMETSDE